MDAVREVSAVSAISIKGIKPNKPYERDRCWIASKTKILTISARLSIIITMGEEVRKIIEQPLCFSDRQTWKKSDKYMFISYAHKDAAAVYSDLFVLYNNCLNYWYDKKLSVGDEWDRKVESVVRDPQCAGIILYISPNMIKSAACEKEIRIYKEIVESGRDDFKLIPVSLDGISVNATVRAAYASCSELTAEELDKVLPADRVENVFANLRSSLIYLNRTDNGFHLTKLIEVLKEYDEDLFCSDDVALDKLSRLPIVSTENGVSFIRLGTYPQKAVDEDFAVQSGVRLTQDGKITIRNGCGFKHLPIRWIIIKNDNTKAVAISEFVLDKCHSKDIDAFLSNFVENSVADEEIRDCIDDVTLPLLSDLEEYDSVLPVNEETQFCKSYPKTSLWVIYWGRNENGVTPYYKKFSPMTSQISVNMLCGVRPCITIDIDKLLRQYTR